MRKGRDGEKNGKKKKTEKKGEKKEKKKLEKTDENSGQQSTARMPNFFPLELFSFSLNFIDFSKN